MAMAEMGKHSLTDEDWPGTISQDGMGPGDGDGC